MSTLLLAGGVLAGFYAVGDLFGTMSTALAIVIGMTPADAATAAFSANAVLLAITVFLLLWRIADSFVASGDLRGAWTLLRTRGALFAIMVAFYMWVILTDRLVWQYIRLNQIIDLHDFQTWDAVERIVHRLVALLGICFVSLYEGPGVSIRRALGFMAGSAILAFIVYQITMWSLLL